MLPTISYLTANQAWCVVLSNGDLLPIDDRRIWNDRAELEARLQALGFAVEGNTVIRLCYLGWRIGGCQEPALPDNSNCATHEWADQR